MIQLEDNYLDIIKKACVGKGLGEKKIAQLVEIPRSEISCFFKGEYSEAILQHLAQILDLDFPALKNHAENISHPPEIHLDGLQLFQSKFPYTKDEIMWVNHYILFDAQNKTAILFDTGTDASPSLQWLDDQELSLDAIYITHQHRDHIYALEEYLNIFPETPIFSAQKLTQQKHDIRIVVTETPNVMGRFALEAFATPGHTEDGLSYLIKGLSTPVIIVGDALFAHSQGGVSRPKDYQLALKSNQAHIFSQDKTTIIAPGHGPMTTVGHEQNNNPFYA